MVWFGDSEDVPGNVEQDVDDMATFQELHKSAVLTTRDTAKYQFPPRGLPTHTATAGVGRNCALSSRYVMSLVSFNASRGGRKTWQCGMEEEWRLAFLIDRREMIGF